MPAGTLQLPTTGTVTGLQNNQDANTALAALAVANQGGAAPTTGGTGLSAMSGVFWHDTTNNQLFVRDQADANWLPIGSFDETNKFFIPLLRNYIAGFESSAPGGASTVTIGPGTCADSGNTRMLQIGSTFTKTTAAWVAGSGNGGLDTGSIAASTPYFLWAIYNPTTILTDYLMSLSGTAPAMPTGYTVKRLLRRWFKTDASSHIWQYQDRGDETIYGVRVTDVNGAALTTGSRTLRTLSVPSGFVVNALFRIGGTDTSGTLNTILLTSPDETDQAVSGLGDINLPASSIAAEDFNRRTNTSAQIADRAAGSGTITYATYGFIWTGGRQS